jgi:hypothetical protein
METAAFIMAVLVSALELATAAVNAVDPALGVAVAELLASAQR